MFSATEFPLISVIIPTYNYGHFISRAIDSVLQQDYPHFEVIVIDDGSTDRTVDMIPKVRQVHYFYQDNKGLAASRNAGIDRSRGAFLLFLDADDWLEPNALTLNYLALKDHPYLAFVSGDYNFVNVSSGNTERISIRIKSEHYLHLLQSNYIGMHATILFRRWVFDEVRYDVNLRSCEDYDLYLRIARTHPVLHHNTLIANYYFHENGLSHNYDVMKETIKRVMLKQNHFLRTDEEREAFKKGLEQCSMYDELLLNSKKKMLAD